MVTYYTDLFSPETREAFLQTDRMTTGFRRNQEAAAGRVQKGDIFVCYVTRIGRWWGLLEVLDDHHTEADGPLFNEGAANPFVVRFRVRPLVLLEDVEHAVPIRDPEVWDALSFTRGQDRRGSTWTGRLRRSITSLDAADGELLEHLIRRQAEQPAAYVLDEDDRKKLTRLHVRGVSAPVPVSVPGPDGEVPPRVETWQSPAARTSHHVQATLARLGEELGLSIWAPRPDRERMLAALHPRSVQFLDELPLNYDEATLRTIENIDVLWLRGRSIVRAFEVEHTTAIYSGLLRMADLLALQPNMDIKLHIVAPSERRQKVFDELLRPVFSLLERGPLAALCTYLSYESLEELASLPNLQHTRDSIIDEYMEEPEEV